MTVSAVVISEFGIFSSFINGTYRYKVYAEPELLLMLGLISNIHRFLVQTLEFSTCNSWSLHKPIKLMQFLKSARTYIFVHVHYVNIVNVFSNGRILTLQDYTTCIQSLNDQTSLIFHVGPQSLICALLQTYMYAHVVLYAHVCIIYLHSVAERL